MLEIILKKCNKTNFSKNLVYAGCALNSLATKIYEKNYFKIFLFPRREMVEVYHHFFIKNYKFDKYNLQNPYIGPSFSNETIKKIIEKTNLNKTYNVKFFKDKKVLYQIIAKQIKENNIVGFFNGRMEFGARALGNRSILANPNSPNIKDIINLKIKKRENFRPFAPSILFDHKIKWFNNSKSNPYMSSVENISNMRKTFLQQHFDGTGRVQTVSKEHNIDFYNLIYEF